MGDHAPAGQNLDALIIGAGFAGLYQLHTLRDRLGLRAKVLEQAGGVGGTWYWNRYPGARCDSESHGYCFSFDEALVRDWNYSERYPAQPEVLAYLNHVADRFELRRDILFDTRVTRATWSDTESEWQVETGQGRVFRARFLITAVGCLSAANVPEIPGLQEFEGQTFHTGHWPHDGVDLAGRRVGVVGTGSTAIQAVPVIAGAASHLTVFQRTANYSVPARNRKLDPDFIAGVKADWPRWRALMRGNLGGHPWPSPERLTMATPAPERRRIFEEAWREGGLRFRSAFRDMVLDEAANREASDFIRQQILAIVHDPQTAALLTGFDHPFGTKRPPIDTGYFETFNLPHVHLHDLRADPIQRIGAAGIETRDRSIPLDIIVFATGFDAMTGPLLKLDLVGRGGTRLADAWREGPRTYLGLGVAAFPNLFTITGPGSPSVLTNMPVAIEQHVEWVADCIAWMRGRHLARIEAEPHAIEDWQGQVAAAAAATLYPRAASSWYLGANIPGKPRGFMPYVGGMDRYRGICDSVAARDYRGFAFA